MGNKYLEKIASEIEQLEKEALIGGSLLARAGAMASKAGKAVGNYASQVPGDAKALGGMLKKNPNAVVSVGGNSPSRLKILAKNKVVQVAGGAVAAGGIAAALRGNNDK